MKEYTAFDSVSIGAGNTVTKSVSMDNDGMDLNYAIAVKGDASSVDVAVDVEVPGDSEVYDTNLKGTNNLSGIDLTDGGEVRSLEHTPELSAIRISTDTHISVTNNDGGNRSITVKILQFGNK